LITVSGNNFTL